MNNSISKVPGWALVLTYLVIVLILGLFGDVFTLVTGALIMLVVFANGYNKEHLDRL